MSAEITTDQAVAVVQDLYNEVFFSKLAELGHVPTSEADAMGMLKAGFDLDTVEQHQKQAQLQKSAGLYASAADSLSEMLSGQPQQSYSKSAAERILSDPVYMNSVVMAMASELADTSAEA